MGGCASRPKEFDAKEDPLVLEDPNIPKTVEGETVSQDNGGEAKKEEPSIDSSKMATKTEEPPTESKPAAEAEAGSGVAAKPIEDKVEATVETKETVKEEEEKEAAVKVQVV